MTLSGACWCRILQPSTVPLLLLSLSLLFLPVRSSLVNITVDDTFRDPTTGSVLAYSSGPSNPWNAGSPNENCPGCRLNPSNLDLSQIYQQTWHETTYYSSETPATITVRFTGSAVYVFNIIPNTVSGDSVTAADISFSIDGEDVGRFTRSPDSSSTILYHQLVYSNPALDHGPHTLVMTPNANSLILFDYLVYTAQSDDGDTSSTSSTPTDTPQPPPASSSVTPASTSTSSQRSSPSLSPSPSSATGTPSDNRSSSSGTSTSAPRGSFQTLSSITSSLNGSSHSPASSSAPTSTTSGQSTPSKTPVGAVIGAVLGGIALLLGVALAILCLRRRRKPSTTPSQTAHVSAADRGNGSARGYDSHEDGGDGASFGAQSTVSTTPMISSPRWLDGASTHHGHSLHRAMLAFDVNVPRPDSDVMGASLRASTVPASLARSPSSSTSTPEAMYGSAKHRAELARRLETLQSTRSALSSPDLTGVSASRSEANSNSGGRGTTSETAIRDLEAEIAHLRAALTAVNAGRLADEYRGDSRSELLPAYAE